MTDAWVRLGVVARAHGIRGAIRLKLDNPNGRTLRKGIVVRLTGAGSSASEHRVDSYAAQIVTLEGIGDRDQADGLRGRELTVRRADFPDKDLYLIDLVGAVVVLADGTALGHVQGFVDNGKQPLMIVKRAHDEVTVPYVAPIVVEATPQRVVLRPPAGLFDDDAIEDTPEDG